MVMMNKPAKSFRDLLVWQKAHKFVVRIYEVSKDFPQHELYGLTSQLRRAVVSVPANIVEGFRRRAKADKVRFLNIAQSSLEEARYFLILVEDLKYADVKELERMSEEISKMLDSYVKSIQATAN